MGRSWLGRRARRGRLATGALVVAAAGILCLCFWPKGRQDGGREVGTNGTERLPPSPANGTQEQESQKSAADPGTKAAPAPAAKPKPGKEFVKRPGALQLPDGRVLTFPPPKEGEIRKVYSHGRMYACDHLGNFEDITPRDLFHTPFEANFLALAQADGAFIPAFLTGLDPKEVRAYLTKPYQPIGDETEKELEQLKAYEELRRAVLEYMDQGGSFDDYVMETARFEKNQRMAHAVGLRSIASLVKAGKIEEAKRMRLAVDQAMKQQGYNPVKLPARFEKLLQ
ncbi:MAG: hypothetical protein ACI4X9_03855 [Kiritimatiellia bacterium]